MWPGEGIEGQESYPLPDKAQSGMGTGVGETHRRVNHSLRTLVREKKS